ncbi:flagellar hook protein FlgE [Acidobacteria bacterium AB60]|nr:flagellar hook protein FlgE [Acidobacteria bacterium AB60]
MASFFIPLTGLNADSTSLNTIANDLANMSTTGFKSQSATFSDLFYQQIGATGSGDPIQTGAGTKIATITTDFSNGTPNATGVNTDVALQGNGFFMVSNSAGSYLTRNGHFSTDSAGNLITANGMSVMGYPAKNGVVNTAAPIAPINLPIGQVLSPKATTSLSMTTTLDSSGNNAVFPATIDVFDSLGEMHTATITYTQTGVNAWSYSVALPAADTGGVLSPVTGTMAFDANGNLSTVNGAAVGTAPGQVSSIPLVFNGLTDQANNLAISWNLMSSAGTPIISQVAATSAVSSPIQDGYASGQYKDFSIGSDGTVTVTFSNQQKLNVGQIALGNVTNPQGLKALGDGNYSATLASGAVAVGTSGSAGLGTIQNGALEGSNVNISGEFSALIMAQRAFEANSKTITTFDTITQETIQMIH